MDTKRLSELKAPENIESAHVLGEENGVYVKFPARELGKVKTVNGADPDENGNVALPIPESITPPAAAAVGQAIVVKAVDESGKPTEWEAADFPNGASIDVTASVGQTIVVEEVDASGKPTKWKAADYQERTHWSEETVILPETTGEIAEEDGDNFFFITDKFFTLELGKEYTVTYNGTEYVCVCDGEDENLESGTNYVRTLGNVPLLSETGDNGMPFVMYSEGNSEAFACACIPLDGSASVTLSITGVKTTPIPVEYVTNAFPYYIEVTGDFDDVSTLSCTDTVTNVRAIYESGRPLIVKFDLGSGFFGFFNLIMYASNEYGTWFGFGMVNYVTTAGGYIETKRLILKARDDDTFSVDVTVG